MSLRSSALSRDPIRRCCRLGAQGTNAQDLATSPPAERIVRDASSAPWSDHTDAMRALGRNFCALVGLGHSVEQAAGAGAACRRGEKRDAKLDREECYVQGTLLTLHVPYSRCSGRRWSPMLRTQDRQVGPPPEETT